MGVKVKLSLPLAFFLLVTLSPAAASTTDINQIHQLRPHYGSGGHPVEGIDCLSWRLAVETHNLQGWRLVPESCEEYVGHYMLGKQYRNDVNMVADAAYTYAQTLKLAGDGKDVWVFDVDETTLSNLPYYVRPTVGFGTIPYNATAFNEWVAEGVAPAIPGSLKLYKNLLNLGFKIVFLTGTNEAYEKPRISNLKKVGYTTWEKLILRSSLESGSAISYKSKKRGELVKSGYRIWGNMGDQWTDLLGTHVGNRTFKVPDPLYYIS